MPEPSAWIGAAAAGAAVAVAVAAMASAPPGSGSRTEPRSGAAAWLDRRRRGAAVAPRSAAAPEAGARARSWLVAARRSPVVACAAAGAAVGAATGTWWGIPSAVGCALAGAAGGAAIAGRGASRERRRRARRIRAELAPFLELAGLELGAGASPATAIATVAGRSRSELASEVGRLVVASRTAGGESLDAGLARLAEELRLAPLAALAAALATSRDYGTAASQPVRAIALDLRRSQRRELIAISRRALTRVLVPAAVAVLFPFMLILLFPAVVALLQGFS